MNYADLLIRLKNNSKHIHELPDNLSYLDDLYLAVYNTVFMRTEKLKLTDLVEDLENRALIGSRANIVKNGNFVDQEIVSYGWDTALNGNKKPKLWNVYNAGVSNPSQGYFAHISTKFSIPVIEMTNNDGRWQALSQTVNVSAQKTYTISFDIFQEQAGIQLKTGIIHYNRNEISMNFYSGLYDVNIASSEVGVWVRKKITFTTHELLDYSKDKVLGFYGYHHIGVVYINNVALKRGSDDTCTP